MKFTIVKLVATLTLGLFAAPLGADAQEAGKVYRIGLLAGAPTSRCHGARPGHCAWPFGDSS